ncbi:unnamed protein product [Fusarium venenatum]|uniref:Uncharacterized protein n=1 Tax=Fusarium venenatum TaxID=56646 RepID=A0A2L2TCD9_9HYPO|nr:uncharacterized protein FVRRES_08721 [Fusarium venenatum]CEI68644.1 unnamed protein product [Fusarium venenatum]
MRLRAGGVHSFHTPPKDARKPSADSDTEVAGMAWMPSQSQTLQPSIHSSRQYRLNYLPYY